jgi:hypothetical protein
MTAELMHRSQPGSSVESQPATAAATIIQTARMYFIILKSPYGTDRNETAESVVYNAHNRTVLSRSLSGAGERTSHRPRTTPHTAARHSRTPGRHSVRPVRFQA